MNKDYRISKYFSSSYKSMFFSRIIDAILIKDLLHFLVNNVIYMSRKGFHDAGKWEDNEPC